MFLQVLTSEKFLLMRKSGGFFRRNQIGFKLLENLILWSSGKTSISTSRYIRILNVMNLLLTFSVYLSKFVKTICLKKCSSNMCSMHVQELPPYSHFHGSSFHIYISIFSDSIFHISIFIFFWQLYPYFHVSRQFQKLDFS